MKRLAFIAGLAALVAFAGCQRQPTVDSIHQMFYAGGATTALVLNETKLNAEQRQIVRDIVVRVQQCTPEVGQPLSVKLTEVGQACVDELLAAGKIDSATSVLIMAGVRTAGAGLDLLEARHPVVRKSADYAVAAIDGFSGGFLEYFSDGREADGVLSSMKAGFDVTLARAVRSAATRNGIR